MDSPHFRHTVTGGPARSSPAHADRRWLAPSRVVAAAVGAAAVLAAVGFGAAACLSAVGPTRSTPTSANHITVPVSTDTAVKAP